MLRVEQRGAFQLHRAEVIARNQRLHVGQFDVAVSQPGDGFAAAAVDREVIYLQVAGELQLWRRLRLHEVQGQLAAEQALGNRHRHRRRRVAQVARQVEPVELEADDRFAVAGERLGLAVDAQRAAVHRHGQQRLHEDVGGAGQVGQERDTQFELLDVVLCAQQAIVEADVAAVDADVGERETRRLAVRRRRLRGEALDQVGEVEPPVLAPGDGDTRLIEPQFVQHRGQSEQRAPRRVERELVDVDERGPAVRFGQVQLADPQVQRERIEAHLAETQRAPQHLRRVVLQVVAQQRRGGKEAEQGVDQQHGRESRGNTAGAGRVTQLLCTCA